MNKYIQEETRAPRVVRQHCFSSCVVLSGPSLLCSTMSILRYFQPQDGLPNPRGDLSRSMNSEAIALANKEMHGSNRDQWHRRNAWTVQEVAVSSSQRKRAHTRHFHLEDGQLLYHFSRQQQHTYHKSLWTLLHR